MRLSGDYPPAQFTDPEGQCAADPRPGNVWKPQLVPSVLEIRQRFWCSEAASTIGGHDLFESN